MLDFGVFFGLCQQQPSRHNTISGSGSGGGGEPWRADVLSCVVEPGDDDAFDFEALRQQVRAEQPPLATDAKLVDEIIQQWKRTKDDKTFAMRTRFFPSGVKIPGVKWT